MRPARLDRDFFGLLCDLPDLDRDRRNCAGTTAGKGQRTIGTRFAFNNPSFIGFERHGQRKTLVSFCFNPQHAIARRSFERSITHCARIFQLAFYLGPFALWSFEPLAQRGREPRKSLDR